MPEPDEDETPTEYRHRLLDAQHDTECRRHAIRIAMRAASIRKTMLQSVICDEQRDLLEKAAEATEDAADAIWPGDEPMPDPYEIADLDYADDDTTDEEDSETDTAEE